VTRDDSALLKIGLHRGHAIAVKLNERLDYFGQNVNIAARTQQQAGGSEVFLTQDILDAKGVTQLLEGREVTPLSANMKGVGEAIQTYLVAVSS